MFLQIITGFVIGLIISGIAWRIGSLSRSGAVSAVITGGIIFGFGGFAWGVLLLVFFITSNLLSKAFSRRKEGLSEKFSKGSQRDWGQVFANGGIGSVFALVSFIFPGESWIWFAYVGTMAAVTADTWATEIGVLNPLPPWLITSGKKVEPGTSGGISPYGIAATLGGAILIGLIGAIFSYPGETWSLIMAAAFGGVCGSIFDSFLGATIQTIFYCQQCDKETERHPLHVCGSETQQIRGLNWLNNDVVNLLASAVGAVIAVGIWYLFP